MTGDSSEAEERQSDPVKRARRRRKSKRESTEQSSRPAVQSHTPSVCPTVQVASPLEPKWKLVLPTRRTKSETLNLSSLQENSAFLLNALVKRSLSEEEPAPDSTQMATAALDAFGLDAMTPEPEELETLAPNSAVPSPPRPHPLAPEAQDLQSIIGPGDTLEEELRSKLSQLISRANSKDSSTSEDESGMQILENQTDKECETIKEQTERERQRASDTSKDCSASEEGSERGEQVNGQEVRRSERLTKSPSVREEGRIRERKAGGSDRTVDEQEQRRGHKREPNRHSKRQHKRDTERDSEQKRGARSGSSASSPALTPSFQEGVLSDNQVSAQAGSRAAGCEDTAVSVGLSVTMI